MTIVTPLASRPVIVGAGLAGLTVALALAPLPVVILSAAKESSSALAQGGLAAAIGADDAPAQHALDTLAAGAGLCDPEIVRLVTEDGAAVVERLIGQGVRFDRDETGQFCLGLEGAHGKRRIVHVQGDGTGGGPRHSLGGG